MILVSNFLTILRKYFQKMLKFLDFLAFVAICRIWISSMLLLTVFSDIRFHDRNFVKNVINCRNVFSSLYLSFFLPSFFFIFFLPIFKYLGILSIRRSEKQTLFTELGGKQRWIGPGHKCLPSKWKALTMW